VNKFGAAPVLLLISAEGTPSLPQIFLDRGHLQTLGPDMARSLGRQVEGDTLVWIRSF